MRGGELSKEIRIRSRNTWWSTVYRCASVRMPSRLTRSAVFLVFSLVAGSTPALSAEPSPRDRLPAEYTQIKRVVNRIAKHNDLGSQPLIFTVVPGSYAMTLAAGLGLCDDDNCAYFGQINPFRKHGRKIDEILRQNYLYGNIQGWAHSTGTVEIAHQSFRIYGEREDFLACTVAHELAHVLDNHSFHISKKVSELSADVTEKEKELIEAKVSREYEVKADQRAFDILSRAGYPDDTCLDELDFLHKISGDGRETSPTDTHPGYSERLSALKAHIDASKQAGTNQTEQTEGIWLYKQDMNYLKFTPITR